MTPCPDKSNCVNSSSKDEKIYQVHSCYGDAISNKNDIIKVVNTLKNSKVTVAENSYIRAEFTSKVFGFVDDVEFYFPDTKSKDTIIHVRSGARVGYSDFSVNRDRIEQSRLKFDALNKNN